MSGHLLVADKNEPPIESKPPASFRRFNSSPEIIRLSAMFYVHFPLWLRNVEDAGKAWHPHLPQNYFLLVEQDLSPICR